MNMISSCSLYSDRREIVPGGTETVGGEDVAEIGEAAVKGTPAAETLGRKRGDRAMRQRCAEPAILGREPRDGGLQGVVKFGDSGGAAALAVPGGKPVVLGQRVADRLAGLPFARAFLRAHGGDVSLLGRPDAGLRARIIVPLTRA